LNDPDTPETEFEEDIGDATDKEMTDEAWFEYCCRTAWAEHTKQEARVEETATSLHSKLQSNTNVPLGDIRGTWTLYSSQYLECCVNTRGAEIYDEQWNAGTLRIGEEYMDEWMRDRDADVGMEVEFTDAPNGAYNITPRAPRFASLHP
jgi:hypothetical protein